MPAAVTDYLTANYSGYTFQKVFTDKDTSGNTAGYIVIIQYNSTPVGLKFDATGAFVKVLEQREGRDLNEHGWHHGDAFDDRDGKNRDTIALSDLPSAITSYFAANYSQDTLVKAYENRDSSIVVLSKDNGAFATVFDANGAFIKRVELPARGGHPNSIELAALPSAAQTYLTATYPNYVFKQAFEIMQNGTLHGYAVFIDANATKYAVAFDASGNFVKAITVK
ncbi:MAG: PepSY-like domain-containing protein [Segetibacter sp.]